MFAHSSGSTTDDYLRVRIQTQDGTVATVWEVRGAARDLDGVWRVAGANVDAYAGQTIRVIIEAVDGGDNNLVEAAIDDIRIRRQ